MNLRSLLFLLVLPLPACAQTVQQGGTVSYGHAASWAASGVLQDAGTAAAGKLNSLGLYGSGGDPFGITSSATPPPFSGSYWNFGMGVSAASGGTIDLTGPSAKPVTINIQGAAALTITSTGVTSAGGTTVNGHIAVTGTSPTVTNGTFSSGSVTTDTHGTINRPFTPASVSVVTFATPYTTGVPPDCVVTSPTGTAITSYAVTATTLTINTANTIGSFTYMCMQ